MADTTPRAKTDQEILLTCIVKALPYPDQIENISLFEENVVRFTWRGHAYRVGMFGTPTCDEIDRACLVRSDKALLMRTLIERVHRELPEAAP